MFNIVVRALNMFTQEIAVLFTKKYKENDCVVKVICHACCWIWWCKKELDFHLNWLFIEWCLFLCVLLLLSVQYHIRSWKKCLLPSKYDYVRVKNEISFFFFLYAFVSLDYFHLIQFPLFFVDNLLL